LQFLESTGSESQKYTSVRRVLDLIQKSTSINRFFPTST